MRERGFVLWVVVGAIAVAWVASALGWLEHERAVAARTERDAAKKLADARKAETEDWKAKVAEVTERCNAATAKAAAEAAARDQAAEKAIAAAQGRARSWELEADALRSAKAARPSQPLTAAEKACPAGAAVARVRKALAP